MRVFVYWNLHKGLWSVRDQKARKVIAHAPQVFLAHGRAKVSEAGRQRVLREKRKNVHAGIEGELLYAGEPLGSMACGKWQVTYNPYKGPKFVYVFTGKPWETVASRVLMNPDRTVDVSDHHE